MMLHVLANGRWLAVDELGQLMTEGTWKRNANEVVTVTSEATPLAPLARTRRDELLRRAVMASVAAVGLSS